MNREKARFWRASLVSTNVNCIISRGSRTRPHKERSSRDACCSRGYYPPIKHRLARRVAVVIDRPPVEHALEHERSSLVSQLLSFCVLAVTTSREHNLLPLKVRLCRALRSAAQDEVAAIRCQSCHRRMTIIDGDTVSCPLHAALYPCAELFLSPTSRPETFVQPFAKAGRCENTSTLPRSSACRVMDHPR